MNIFQYYKKVKTNGEWDLKNNTNTIFGLAWSLSGTETAFFTKDYFFNDASDVGNYHAGYMGIKAGINPLWLWLGAGTVEIFKDLANGEILNGIHQFNQLRFLIMPFGDEIDDFIWNTTGMQDATKDK